MKQHGRLFGTWMTQKAACKGFMWKASMESPSYSTHGARHGTPIQSSGVAAAVGTQYKAKRTLNETNSSENHVIKGQQSKWPPSPSPHSTPSHMEIMGTKRRANPILPPSVSNETRKNMEHVGTETATEPEEGLDEMELTSSLTRAALKSLEEPSEDLSSIKGFDSDSFAPSMKAPTAYSVAWTSSPIWKAEKYLSTFYYNMTHRTSLENSPYVKFIAQCVHAKKDGGNPMPTLELIHAQFIEAAESIPQLATDYAFSPERCMTLLVTLLIDVYSREARRASLTTAHERLTIFLSLLRLLNYFDEPHAFPVRELLSTQALFDHGIKAAPVTLPAATMEKRPGDWLSTTFPLARTLPVHKPLAHWTIPPALRVHQSVIAAMVHLGAVDYGMAYWTHFCVPEPCLATEPKMVALLLGPFCASSGKSLDVTLAHSIFDMYRKSGGKMHEAIVLLMMDAYMRHRQLDLAENLFHMHVKLRILESSLAHLSRGSERDGPPLPKTFSQIPAESFYTEMTLRLFTMYAFTLMKRYYHPEVPVDPCYILRQSYATLKWLSQYYPTGWMSPPLCYRLKQILQQTEHLRTESNANNMGHYFAYIEKFIA